MSQVDFSENYSPVVDDIIFRMLLLILTKFDFSAKFNVGTVFFYNESEEQFYKECHHGMKVMEKVTVSA